MIILPCFRDLRFLKEKSLVSFVTSHLVFELAVVICVLNFLKFLFF